MADTPWWIAAGAAAVLGVGTALAASSMPRALETVTRRSYRIKGRKNTEVTAHIFHDGTQYTVVFEFPYGLRSKKGDVFEIPPDEYPENGSGFRSIKETLVYADGQMDRFPWFSVSG